MRQLTAGGRVASAFKVRCIRSWRPFCCGLPGSISSGMMPSRTNQAERVESLASETVAKGTPLSVRMRSGMQPDRQGGFRVAHEDPIGAVARPSGKAHSMRDFDDNEFPLAYLITFRCYGSWLHGDERRSMSRKRNIYGTPRIAFRPRLRTTETAQLKHPPITLSAQQRRVVENAIREVCLHREYYLRAINVRTNHVHAVVSGMSKPEPILAAFKTYSTRGLRRAKLLSACVTPWARHGSTVYLWKEGHVEKAVEYVLLGQGDDLPRFD